MAHAKRFDERVRSAEASLFRATKSLPRWVEILVIGAATLLAGIQLITH